MEEEEEEEEVSSVYNIFLKGQKKKSKSKALNLRNFTKLNILKAELSL